MMSATINSEKSGGSLVDSAILEKFDIFRDGELRSLYISIRDSRAFRRLQGIRFLGAIDYAFIHQPNGRARFRRHNRFEHSLGVALLAMRYAELVGSTRSDRKLLLAAAMLHDLGHAPLSHSLEPLFWLRFGINHHVATRSILEGRAPIGAEMVDILREEGMRTERVLELLSGACGDFHGFFSGPINFDTIDGISRAYSYVGGLFAPDITQRILEAALFREGEHHRRIVDRFWSVKDAVYLTLIGGRKGVLADHVSRSCVDRLSSLRPEDFYSTERSIFSRVATMREALQDDALDAWSLRDCWDSMSFNLRRFYISGEVDFDRRQDAQRYRQTKVQRTIPLHQSQEPTLFDAAGMEYWRYSFDVLCGDRAR